MTALLVVLVTLALAVASALFFMQDPGYVLITLKPWSIEISLALFIVALALSGRNVPYPGAYLKAYRRS